MNYVKAPLPQSGDVCVVGLSGGVDSTLAAMLLKEKGCRVIGATMSLWDGKLPDGVLPDQLASSCYGPSELKNIRECEEFCKQNSIEYHVINVQKEYQENVIEYFKEEYRNGRTPNPCIRCNQSIKFGAFIKGIEKLGIKFDYFCTGHYANVVQPEAPFWNCSEKPYMIQTACDATKDQTYFLYRLSSELLSKIRFPLGGMIKSDVFEMARERGLLAANRKESQDFVPQETFDMFFSDKPSVPGDIVDLDGKKLGTHRGIEHYTVGQRRGLGVAMNIPYYVHSIDAATNTVVLAKNEELNSDFLIADDMVWACGCEPEEEFEANVKIRLASKPVLSKISKRSDGRWLVSFSQSQRAVAPGQSAVFYKDGVILGGGVISLK